jgi:hypothetical protein
MVWEVSYARATRCLRRMKRERPGALLARRIGEGMEADDLLCSRNARLKKALVGRAQWKINQPPSLEKNEQAWREHVNRSMCAVKCSLGHSFRVSYRGAR